MLKNIGLTVVSAFILLFVFVPTVGASSNVSVEKVKMLSDGSNVSRSASGLLRHELGFVTKLRDRGLTPGYTYTMWWVVFNNPESCTTGMHGLNCGEPDLFNPETQASVAYGAGKVADEFGEAVFITHLKTGDMSSVLIGAGLTNPFGAEVHLVIRDHGPVVPNLLNDQLTTLGGGCDPSTVPVPQAGQLGTYMCEDVHFSAHGS